MSERFLRHTKMTAWGIGVVLEERGGQLAVLFMDGNRRSFKVASAAQLLVDAAPESEEQRQLLLRARATGKLETVAVNLDLEAQLQHGFEDPAPFLVYADWLQQREDPRGALIQAQHRNKVTLERSLLKTHAEVLIPRGFTKRGDFTLHWKLGFLASVRIGKLAELEEVLEGLLQHPSAVLLQELILDGDNYRGTPIEVIAQHGKQLQRLVLGGDAAHRAWATGDIAGLFALPRLRELEVTGDRVVVTGRPTSSTLERLAVTTSRDDPATERALMTLAAPALRSFAFHCADVIDPPPAEALAGMPALRSLSLRGTQQTRAWLARILAAPCGKQLVELDLRHGDLDDRDARQLATQRAALPALAVLDVSRNSISAEAAAALADLAPTVHAQSTPEDLQRAERVRMPPMIGEAARVIAGQPKRWETFGIDTQRDRLWGRYLGSIGTYEVAIERGSRWAACSCPAADSPCKHAQALYVMYEEGRLAEARPPSDHYERAGRKRYRNSFE